MTEQDQHQHHEEEELEPSTTPGYKVGEKKTVDELANLDANDESLRKWKESLGLGKATGPADDPRRVVVLQLAMEVEGRPDIVLDLSSPDSIEHVKKSTFVIKEGVSYRLKIKFRIQHEIVSGLKYIQNVKRVNSFLAVKSEEMVGSYGPAAEPYEKIFPVEEAPKGMLARGQYRVTSKFMDDDKVSHLEWVWQFHIKKDWE
ncbi:immunoglobulin E-set [Thamnocephalis sphaerospora]|uniref:Rho GDP-dissociation inhibitor n=1 Tax=Thamnocephalis sphaerospora TaxID=78915 RepID=A0A4P9XYT3_9FUNG|nr:immunoglobulin E-set [Thamnocephalis sphaerospora]|eukprot:RKP10871.1 immunoglobulin E-set [Thamnocephalis sphaerospora]